MSDVVQQALERAKLQARTEEVERLQRNYPVIAGWIEQLRLEEARYAEPAMLYRAPRAPNPNPRT